eukprot:1139784-Prorocentrum_minimum.AAC.1
MYLRIRRSTFVYLRIPSYTFVFAALPAALALLYSPKCFGNVSCWVRRAPTLPYSHHPPHDGRGKRSNGLQRGAASPAPLGLNGMRGLNGMQSLKGLQSLHGSRALCIAGGEQASLYGGGAAGHWHRLARAGGDGGSHYPPHQGGAGQ